MNAIVETRYGRLQGIAHSDHLEFRGVPYARPPVGALRFAAPCPPEPWAGIRRADRFADACSQPLNPLHGITHASEDCLYLNLWAPPPSSSQLRPVMVWIHGGGFCSGSGSQIMYRGKNLALGGDMVVVTLNYRLGVLGFLHLDQMVNDAGLVAPVNNVGLRDIVAALQWVQENIAAFGGDPQHVTVFGESAGAMCISSLLAMPSAKGLFKRAILQSGGADFVMTREEAQRVAYTFLDALGVGEGQYAKLLEFDTAQLLKAQQSCQQLAYNRGRYQQHVMQRGMTLIPVIDGELLPQSPLKALQDGAAKGIPVMVSCTRDEWNLFLHVPEQDGLSVAQRHYSDLDKSRLIDMCEQRLPGLGEKVANTYEDAVPHWIKQPAMLDVFSAFESDRMFRIPALRIAEAQARYRNDVFVGHFDYDEGPMGACHGIDLPLVFGHTDTAIGKALTGGSDSARKLSRQVQGAWIAFARSGNPSTDAIGIWKPWQQHAQHAMHFRKNTRVGKDPARHIRHLWEGVL